MSKFERFSTAGKTAAKVAGKHALHLGSQAFRSKESREEKNVEHYDEVAKEIFKTLSSLKGLALKAAQLMSLEFELLPPEFQKELRKACYQAPPLNRAVVRKVIQNQLGQAPELAFSSFNPDAFAAASIGQVHKAESKNGDALAVKIQYPGITQTIHHDLGILKILLLKLPIAGIKGKTAFVKTFLTELEDRFLEETDYELEAKSMTWFKERNSIPHIKIPKVYPDYSAKTVLSMEYLRGRHLKEWLDSKPSKKERNHVAQSLWDFFAYFFSKEQRFHADPNPGNYLIMDSGEIGILDFGCIKECDPDFPKQLGQMIEHYTQDDQDKIIQNLQSWGMIPKGSDAVNQKVKESISFFQNWVSTPFRSKSFDFAKHPEYMAQRMKPEFRSMLETIHNTNHNFVMFDRTYMGLLSIFHLLKAEVRFYF